ncbi:hypothetical protein [Lentibacillus saliphilus]|uniref:hypothetical protein n=1 Tax=Lentibacillus saliphilus TaxID=2737028 RepID=UPI001C307B37|nr:hypothetical protein [Lentibacillus saliphilus]
MMKKRMVLPAGVIVLLLVVFLAYWLFFSKPSAFPEDEALKEKMNDIFPGGNVVATIQDAIHLDEEHVFVPFKSSNGQYGAGYWIWEHLQWKPAHIDTKGEPMIWKTAPKNFHIVWNLHPDDALKKADFYLIQERGYNVSGEEHTYIPHIQMKETVNLEDETYGVKTLSESWNDLLTQKASESQDPVFNHFFPNPHIFISWMPLNRHNQLTFPEHSVNGGNSYTHAHIDLDFIRIINEVELE